MVQVLDTYKPLVWEYARLNITHNVLSKRKLNKLVTQNYVDGWDDPRLLTLAGLRRRGVRPQVSPPPNALLHCCAFLLCLHKQCSAAPPWPGVGPDISPLLHPLQLGVLL